MTSTALSRTLSDIAWVKLQLSRGREYEAILLDKLAELEAQAAALGCPQYTSNWCENEIIPNATGCECSSQ